MKYGSFLLFFIVTCAHAQEESIRWKVPNEGENQGVIHTLKSSYTIEFEIIWNTPHPANESVQIQLIRNDVPYNSGSKELDEVNLSDIPRTGTVFSKTVNLVEGQNIWKAHVITADNKVIRSSEIRIMKRSGKPNLYLLCIGVPYDLKYTEQDAKAIFDRFKTQQGHKFEKVEGKVLICSENTRLSKLGQELSDLRRQPFTEDDVLIVFASSHGRSVTISGNTDFGVVSNDARFGVKDPRYVLLLYQKDIIANIANLPCKRIVLLDACHSGTAKSDKNWVGKLDQSQTIVSQTPSGIITIASSSADEASWEHENWKHGAFTYALLEGLDGNADLPNKQGKKDYEITVSELATYVSERVPALAQELYQKPQHPLVVRADGYDFPIFNYKTKATESTFKPEPCITAPVTPIPKPVRLAVVGILPEKSEMDWPMTEKTVSYLKKAMSNNDVFNGDEAIVRDGTAIAILDGYPPSGRKLDAEMGANFLCIISRTPTSFTRNNATKLWTAEVNTRFTFISTQTKKTVFARDVVGTGTAVTERDSENSAIKNTFPQLTRAPIKLLDK